jgi:predicted AlkP superfamily phosphohydrolase/phosphomutase
MDVPPDRGRTVVLGIDSLDLVLVQRWAAEGLLPFFDSMLRNCSLARLSVVSRVLQGALWPTLLTGHSPGRHGIFYLTQLTSGTYELDQVSADRGAPQPYYGELDSNGLRCAIVDIPNDVPIAGFKGLHVVDWLTEFQFWRFATQPATSQREIEDQLGTLNKSGGYGPTQDSLEGHRSLRRKLEKSMAMKTALTSGLLQRTDLDHIFVVFAEPHKAGHFLWKYMDQSHPDHVEAEPYLRDGLLGIYQLLDRQLEQLSGQLTARDNFVVLADHGMQANYRGDQFVGPILEKLELCGSGRALRLDGSSSDSPAPGASARRLGGRIRSAVRSVINATAPVALRRVLRRRFGAAARIDWSQVKVFQLPTDRNSYLRINLRQREPEGIVARGGEYAALLSLLEREFRALINVATGNPAVEEVFRVHELYPGPRVDDLPDLAILWSSDAPINAVESPRLGRLEIRAVEDRSGNHRAEGFLLARGPGIRPRVTDLYGDILQVPATLLALHGVCVPDHYDMPPLHGLLTGAHDVRSEPRVA